MGHYPVLGSEVALGDNHTPTPLVTDNNNLAKIKFGDDGLPEKNINNYKLLNPEWTQRNWPKEKTVTLQHVLEGKKILDAAKKAGYHPPKSINGNVVKLMMDIAGHSTKLNVTTIVRSCRDHGVFGRDGDQADDAPRRGKQK